jgi:endo-1,4-beta-xylanase
MKNKGFMKRNAVTMVLLVLAACSLVVTACTGAGNEKALKDALAGKFYIGSALSVGQVDGKDSASMDIVLKHFNTITAENCMKSALIQPREGEFSFENADKFVEFGEKHGMHIVGHTLIWHSQAPRWFFTDSLGNDVTREVLVERMKTHIHTVVGRYKGRVHGWDVVNEAIENDGSWRKTKFYEIIGEDYIDLAFQFAHEADPDAELYYNDYSMADAGRRDAVVRMVNDLKGRGIKIDGIGLQGHFLMNYPSVEEYEKTLVAFGETGAKLMITELDMTVLQMPGQNRGANVGDQAEYQAAMNPYAAGLPDSVATVWNDRMEAFFDLFLKHSDKITRVTLWGVTDNHSWKNNWPVRGRTDYPLLWDRNYQPKPVVGAIVEAASKMK